MAGWQIMAISLASLFVGLGLICWLICCCCSRGGCAASCEERADMCCGPMCASQCCGCNGGCAMCDPQHCCGPMCDPQHCCGPMCDPQQCCAYNPCCDPTCTHQCCGPSCCDPACCGPACCGSCCYYHVEAPAPVVRSAPIATRSPVWPQQQQSSCNDFRCPPTGFTPSNAFGKSMDGNYSSGKPMYGGGEVSAQCGPCHGGSRF